MANKTFMVILAILVVMLSLGASFAQDDSNQDLSNLAIDETPGTFTELANAISGTSSGGTLELTKNYTNTDGYNSDGIIIDKGITIDGKGHTIDAQGKSRIFYIKSTSVTLKNINFINGRISDQYGGSVAGLFSDVTVINSTFTNTTAEGGGAIYCHGGSGSIVINSSFTNTSANSEGGAIYFDNFDGIVIDSKFNGCHGDSGSDIYSNSAVTLMGNDYDGKSTYNSTDIVADSIINLDGTFAEVQYRINITPVNGFYIFQIKNTLQMKMIKQLMLIKILLLMVKEQY